MSTVILMLIAGGVLALDQSTKYWAQAELAARGSLPVIPRIFHLTLIHNQGAAFGLWQGGVFFLMAVSLVCGTAIVLMLIRRDLFVKILGLDPDNLATRLALALILGGAIGNMIDRLRFGYVVDFLDFRVWPVFNVADSAITIGGVLIGLSLLRHNPLRKEDAARPV